MGLNYYGPERTNDILFHTGAVHRSVAQRRVQNLVLRVVKPLPQSGSVLPSNTRQNLRVSSAEAVQTVALSGAITMCSTRCEWPWRSATLLHPGYRHRLSWFSLKPCELRISLSLGFHSSEHTWLSVFTVCISLPVSMFQNRMVWSEVPPPVASRFLCQGHQASALTAALWPTSWCRTLPVCRSQIRAVLSLLPEASPQASCLSPHTSPRWPVSFRVDPPASLQSWPRILVSLEPVKSMPQVKAAEETRLEWGRMALSSRCLSTSQSSTLPEERPMASWWPWGWKEREHTYSSSFWVSSWMAWGEQRQTRSPSPMASTPLRLQSSRLRQQSSLISGASSIFSGYSCTLLRVALRSWVLLFRVISCLTEPIQCTPSASGASPSISRVSMCSQLSWGSSLAMGSRGRG